MSDTAFESAEPADVGFEGVGTEPTFEDGGDAGELSPYDPGFGERLGEMVNDSVQSAVADGLASVGLAPQPEAMLPPGDFAPAPEPTRRISRGSRRALTPLSTRLRATLASWIGNRRWTRLFRSSRRFWRTTRPPMLVMRSGRRYMPARSRRRQPGVGRLTSSG